MRCWGCRNGRQACKRCQYFADLPGTLRAFNVGRTDEWRQIHAAHNRIRGKAQQA